MRPPRSVVVRARSLRAGDVFMESDEHPARVVRRLGSSGSGKKTTRPVRLMCLYLWQRGDEHAWEHQLAPDEEVRLIG